MAVDASPSHAPPGRPPAAARRASLGHRVYHSFLLRRLLRSAFVIWVVATGVFLMVRLLPGNPVDVYVNQQIALYGKTYEQASAEAENYFRFDPTTPIWQQYLDYLGGLLRGDMGTSIATPGVTVLEKISHYLPWTLYSVGLALLISITIGLLLGMIMAYRRGGVIDHAVSVVGSIFHAIPNYLLAILIVVVGAVQLGIIDYTRMRGNVSPGVTPELSLRFLSDIGYHATLPMITYILTTFGTWALIMKSSTTQVLGEDYVTVAKARGLKESRVQTNYVGRNALLPLIAQIATQAGFIVGGAIFVEQTFSYEGIGLLLFESINSRDYPTIQGVLLVVTITVVLANLAADLVNAALDPRIRLGEGGAA
ncbi:ABC transporter permease [Brachybacterium sp. YJGR34]|uniref:ABC transporter permease n=1 Tax=Brachybacterium sp. YJGR34 TaxID=2059911 RepID=UPI000E0B775A|nr:ABC transporter permease [Brachybacterium sp. YJGR34]